MDNNQIQSTSELAIRREKLANLVSAGKFNNSPNLPNLLLQFALTNLSGKGINLSGMSYLGESDLTFLGDFVPLLSALIWIVLVSG